MTVGCKDIGIKKSEFVARAEFLKARTEFLKGSVREKWKGVSLYIHSSSFHEPGRISTSQSKLYSTNTDVEPGRNIESRDILRSTNRSTF